MPRRLEAVKRAIRLLPVLLSATLHAAVVAALLPASDRRPSPLDEPVTIELEIAEEGLPAPVRPEPRQTLRPGREPPHRRVLEPPRKSAASRSRGPDAPPVASSDLEGSSRAQAEPVPAEPPRIEGLAGSGAKAPKLTLPSSPWSVSRERGGAPARDPHGQVVRNEPGALPDRAETLEKESREVEGRVSGWLGDALAEHRVQSGAVDDYFREMGEAMVKRLAEAPHAREDEGLLRQFATNLLRSARQYAATGDPYAPAEAPEARSDPLKSPLERLAEGRSKSAADAFQKKLDMGSSLRDFGDGKFGGKLVAIVEIRQKVDGELTGALLVQPSGDKAFDRYVLLVAPDAVAGLPAPRPSAAGVHPDGIRSTWSFEGRLVYKRSSRDISLKDNWYLAALIPFGLLTGNFDETTGSVDVVDPLHPQFQVRVRLLRVY
jgi:hypothetical protein